MASTYPVLAQRFRRAGTNAYTIAVPVADLGEILPVPNPDEPFEGNRRVDSKHADEFGQYWMRATTWAVPPILVDTPRDLGEWFVPDTGVGALPGGFAVGTLELPRPSRSGLQILDGQHRVLGWMRLGVAMTEALSSGPARAAFAGRALERMEQDRVTVEIVEALPVNTHKQYFFDIAANARGISASLASSFDQNDPVRLAAQTLAEEHPLLTDRVEFEMDRALAGSSSLLSLKTVVDLVGAAIGGVHGVPEGARRRELRLARVVDVAGAAFDALLDEFSDLGDVVEGERTPAELRTSSLLGSVTILRALVSAFHDIAVRDALVDQEGDRRARSIFRRLSSEMRFPLSDFWWTTGAFADQGSRSPGARRQDVQALVTAIVGEDDEVPHVDAPHVLEPGTSAPEPTESATGEQSHVRAGGAAVDVDEASGSASARGALRPGPNSQLPEAGIQDAVDEMDDLDEVIPGLDLLSLYLTQTAREPLLTAQEEIDLATRIEVGVFARERLEAAEDRPRGDESMDATLMNDLRTLVDDGERARQRFVCANLRLVVSVARAWGAREVELVDRIQLGNLGLLRAVEKFDFTAGTKFSTYATWWIRQSISRGVADEGRTIRLPVYVVDSVRAVEKARRELRRAGKEDGDAAVAALCDLSEEKVAEYRPLAHPVLSLHDLQERSGDHELTDWQRLPDFSCSGATSDHVDEVLDQDFDRVWRSLMLVLDEREQSIVQHRFGLDGGDAWTLEELGENWGVTRERVRQIEKKTMDRLRSSVDVLDAFRGLRDVGWASQPAG